MNKRIVLGVVAFALIAGILVGYYLYNKPRDGATSGKAAFELQALAFAEEYSSDEEMANSKYLGKIIQVSGTVLEISNEGQLEIYLEGNGMSNIRCVFTESPGDAPSSGEVVTIKGKCDGSLLDVILNDCVIVTK